jgi:hypothetical protein
VEARQIREDGTCFLCCRHVPESDRVDFAELGIIVHAENCAGWCRSIISDYDASRRGWWSQRDVLVLIQKSSRGLLPWEPPQAAVDDHGRTVLVH